MPTTVAEDSMDALNDAQRRVALHDSGPLIVLAGPGTGKTRVIVARLRRLLDQGAEPESLLALTFSRKAAEEMRVRLGESVGPTLADRIHASTFHAFGYSLLTRFGDMLGLRRQRTIIDSAQSRRLLRTLIHDHGLLRELAAAGPDAPVAAFREFLSRCRRAARTAAQAQSYADAWAARLRNNTESLTDEAREAESFKHKLFADCARLMTLYERACARRGYLSYDDCLSLPLRLLGEHPVVGAIIRQEIRHIVVDEFQDVDRGQIALLQHLAPPQSRVCDICVVGDDDQAIYGFRGAEPRSFSRFEEVWTNATTIALTVNYRSGPAIIAAANAHIRRCDERFAPDKAIEPADPDAPSRIEGVILDDDRQASAVVAAMILADRADNPDRPYSAYAVLTRNNTEADTIAGQLAANGFPVTLRRLDSPQDDEGVRDLLAWISLLAEPAGPHEPGTIQRLLMRPPFFVPFASISHWQSMYRRSGTLAAIRGAPRETDDEPAGEKASFSQWLRAGAMEDAAVARFLSMLDGWRAAALSAPADLLVERIIRESGVAHTEDLSPHQRVARVTHLVRVLRFARGRQPSLEPPGDIAALWRYYNDLDENERHFASPGLERLDYDPDGDTATDSGSPDQGEGVQVLTAHSSKGLEFDTVFLSRCRPGGFPDRKRPASEETAAIPADFLEQSPVAQSDEERRLFYVACTRARRRLVLLAKRKKTTKGATDYFIELTLGSPGVEIAQRDAPDLIEDAGAESPTALDADLGDEPTSRRRRDLLVDRAMADARGRAYAALHDAASPALAPDAFVSITKRLSASALELRALEHLRQTGALPADIPDELAERLTPIAERLCANLGPASLTRPVPPPLELSYSKITDYQRCPRCFYTKYILGLDERKTTELSIGSIIHTSLELFYTEWRVADAEGAVLPGLDRLLSLARSACEREWPSGASLEPAVLVTIDAMLSATFDTLHDPSANILAVERSVRFPYSDPRDPSITHRITAKVDRLDQLPSGDIRIVDYKTGAPRKGLLQPTADDLQLCVYAMALPMLLGDSDSSADYSPGAIPGVAEYWILSSGQRGPIALHDLDIPKARMKIDETITGILSGHFDRGKDCKGLCTILPSDDPGSVSPDPSSDAGES